MSSTTIDLVVKRLLDLKRVHLELGGKADCTRIERVMSGLG